MTALQGKSTHIGVSPVKVNIHHRTDATVVPSKRVVNSWILLSQFNVEVESTQYTGIAHIFEPLALDRELVPVEVTHHSDGLVASQLEHGRGYANLPLYLCLDVCHAEHRNIFRLMTLLINDRLHNLAELLTHV